MRKLKNRKIGKTKNGRCGKTRRYVGRYQKNDSLNIGAFLAILERIHKQEEKVRERKKKQKKAKESKRCDGHGRDSRNDRKIIL